VILVAVAQLFGALMNLAARLLELEAEMHPLQILFARMSITTVLSILYMWWNKVPDFPLGARGIRGVLVIRGVSGFVSALVAVSVGIRGTTLPANCQHTLSTVH
jgi:hypothetical protein